MNQASTKMTTAAGSAQMKTCWVASAIAVKTSCLTSAGSELTVAGLSCPPLVLMCAPEPEAISSLEQEHV